MKKGEYISKIQNLLLKAPYSEYNNKNLATLGKIQKAKLKELSSPVEISGAESSQSMNAKYIVNKAKKTRRLKNKSKESTGFKNIEDYLDHKVEEQMGGQPAAIVTPIENQ